MNKFADNARKTTDPDKKQMMERLLVKYVAYISSTMFTLL